MYPPPAKVKYEHLGYLAVHFVIFAEVFLMADER